MTDPRAEVEALREGLIWALRNNGGECPSDDPVGYERALRVAVGNEPETAWLIERGQSEKQVPTVWYMGGGDEIAPEYGWTTDANRAQRYFSRDAAETAIESRSPIPSHRDRFGRATQHVILARPAPPSEGLREALEEIAFMGGDCPPAMDPESFYRSQFYAAVRTAARAISR